MGSVKKKRGKRAISAFRLAVFLVGLASVQFSSIILIELVQLPGMRVGVYPKKQSSNTFSNISDSNVDSRQQQTSKWRPVCQTPPGESLEEGKNANGYQVLHRMRYLLAEDPLAFNSHTVDASTDIRQEIHPERGVNRQQTKNHSRALLAAFQRASAVKLLCVLPFFTGKRQEEALETFAVDCDEVLILIHPSSGEADGATVRNKTNKYHHLVLDPFKSHTNNNNHKLAQALKMIEYDWLYWASQDRYFVVGFWRSFIATNSFSSSSSLWSSTTTPQVLDTWFMSNPSARDGELGSRSNPQGNTCRARPRIWNRAATLQYLGTCNSDNQARQQLDRIMDNSGNVSSWIAHCFEKQHPEIQCTPVQILPTRWLPADAFDNIFGRKQLWSFLKRYFEIQARPEDPNSFHRVHAILYGLCDIYWNLNLALRRDSGPLISLAQPHLPVTTLEQVGALDTDGRPGYVHDPTYLRRHPLPFTYNPSGDKVGVCDYKPGEGDERRKGYQGLQKIRIHDGELVQAGRLKRVLCMVYTHSGRHDQVRAIAETWGQRCDGFMAASNLTDPSIGAVNLLHEGPETYKNIWLKVRAMLRYAYQHYLQDYDFFHLGGDDHFVIAENLRYTVSTGNWKGPWNQSAPLYLGGSLGVVAKRRYCQGGSGYTLNRVALSLLVESLWNTPECWPHYPNSREDQLMAFCFRQLLDSSGQPFQCMDTNDDKNETRYHTSNVNEHASFQYGHPFQKWWLLPKNHGIAWKEGMGQISTSSVAFHLKPSKGTHAIAMDSGIRRYHAILYNLCYGNHGNNKK